MSNETQQTAGASTAGILGVLFVGLKLTGYIDWPWVWVTAPFWMPLVFVFAVIALFIVIFLIKETLS